eukprot:366102-Chlamydomonas_euryale.AAC.8
MSTPQYRPHIANLWLQARMKYEIDLAETCRRHNVSLLAYSPLAGGRYGRRKCGVAKLAQWARMHLQGLPEKCNSHSDKCKCDRKAVAGKCKCDWEAFPLHAHHDC